MTHSFSRNPAMQHVKSADLAAVARADPAAAALAGTSPRVLFIDNVRWVMILLVLSMHAAVTYSPLGSWYYREHPPLGPASTLFFATYQGVLQGFFMALLFFIAGYFTPSSFDAKGALGFLKGRLYRLGWPTLLFAAVLGPMTEYVAAQATARGQSSGAELLAYFTSGRILSGTGPLWFCAALLIFSAVYALARIARPAKPATANGGRVSILGVVLTVQAIAVSTYLVRLAFPLGASVLNMQLCYFPSYIIMFGLGVGAGRRDWVRTVSDRFASSVAAACVVASMVMWLPLLVLGGALSGNSAAYAGGLTWQAAALSL